MKTTKKIKALVLFSGGLDSRLVAKILSEQKEPKLDIELLYFKLPFGCGCTFSENEIFAKEQKLKLVTLDCTKPPLFEEYLEVIKHPKFGRGSGMNPCIDCKIFMFRKAGEYAKKNNLRIIATGEVLGERPMSQTGNAMKIIGKETGYELLRPLSAKLLPETQAERQGLVNRSNFLAIQGRSRKPQLELAKKFSIKFPNPAGGCLLCEKAYKNRLQDLFKSKSKISPELLSTLSSFRHFRSKETNGKILLGRNEAENLLLENINKTLGWNIIIPEDFPGPTCLFENQKDKPLAENVIKAYSSKNLEDRKKFDDMKL